MNGFDDILEDIFRGVKVKVGLRQQGHIPTVEYMLAHGATWDEIRAGNWLAWTNSAALV